MKNFNILETFVNNISNVDMANAKRIDNEYVHKIDKAYSLISEIKEISKKDINTESIYAKNHKFLWSIALPKYDCSFCFDHELDHLPFTMTIELVRQTAIAISHVIHGVPLTGYTNIMDNLKLEVFKFIELDVPLLLIIEDEMLKNKANRQERLMHFYLYQNKNLCAKIDVNALIMKKNIYQKIRLHSRSDLVKDTCCEKIPVTNLQMLKNKTKTEKLLKD